MSKYKKMLSGVYDGNYVYGAAYDTGHGDLELLDQVFNDYDKACEFIKKQDPRGFLNLRLAVLQFKHVEDVDD